MRTNKPHEKHGMSRTNTYRIWAAMKCRCNDPKSKNYHGRGITVCDRWKNSFKAFYEDMGARPTKVHTIERIKNDGPYSPNNCIWATHKQQARNRRSNVKISYQGVKYLICDLAEKFNVGQKLLRLRYVRYKWPIEKCLINEDFRKYNNKI